MEERLQKFLSQCGIASRRASEHLIRDGLISVNGVIVRDMGLKVDPEKDVVRYKDEIVTREEKMIYIMLNKPKGYITTMHEQYGRPMIVDLIRDVKKRVYPVGRLDFDSSGLLLLTNDGDVAFRLTHPGHSVNKEYMVTVRGIPDEEAIKRLKEGILIDGRMTSPAVINIVRRDKSSAVLRFVIHEGRNRQIRKMCSAVGYRVIDLKRISIGRLFLGNLPEGKWRYLTSEEIKYLKSL